MKAYFIYFYIYEAEHQVLFCNIVALLYGVFIEN